MYCLIVCEHEMICLYVRLYNCTSNIQYMYIKISKLCTYLGSNKHGYCFGYKPRFNISIKATCRMHAHGNCSNNIPCLQLVSALALRNKNARGRKQPHKIYSLADATGLFTSRDETNYKIHRSKHSRSDTDTVWTVNASVGRINEKELGNSKMVNPPRP